MARIDFLCPVYNYARFLPRLIRSLAEQTCQDFRAIILDDGSTDKSWQVLEFYDHDWLDLQQHRQREGYIASLHELFSMAEADYVMALSADDYLKLNCFEVMSRILDERPHIGAVHCDFYEDQSQDSQHPQIVGTVQKSGVSLAEGPGMMCAMFRRECLPYALPEWEHAADWDMLLKIQEHWGVLHLPVPLVVWGHHGASWWTKHREQAEKEALLCPQTARQRRQLTLDSM